MLTSQHWYLTDLLSTGIKVYFDSTFSRIYPPWFGCQMKILDATKKKYAQNVFLHKCVLQFFHTLKLASLGKLKYSSWRPRWPPKDKILNIFLRMWARHIIFVATHRFWRSRNRLSMVKFISDISLTCTLNAGQDGCQNINSPISSLIYGLEL